MKAKLQNTNLDHIYLGTRFREEGAYAERELVDSISDKGILQPITIAPWKYEGEPDSFFDDKKYIILAGGRRYMAAMELDFDTIPCLIRKIDGELDLREIEYTENYFRKDPSWQQKLELVIRIHTLMREKHGEKAWTQRDTAKHLDRSVGGINRVLKLNNMLEKFPSLKEEATEDDAVRKARDILEKITVKDMAKQHTEAAKKADLDVDTQGSSPSGDGEVRTDDPYISVCLNAEKHFIIGDAFQNLQSIIDEDLKRFSTFVEVDPPYGIDLQSQKKGEKNTRELNRYEEVERADYPEWTENLCSLLYGATPKDSRMVYWFGIEWYQMVKDNLTGAGWNVDPIPGLWVKPSGQTNNPDKYLARTYEPFFICSKGDGIPIRQRGRSNVFAFNSVGGKTKYHPTQRPVELIREILQTFAWPSSIILCPFLGSGATLRAAYKENMIGFGWELNGDNKEKFIAAVQGDIDEHIENPDIDDDDSPEFEPVF